MAKLDLPKQLNVCLVARNISASQRVTAVHGALWLIARGLVSKGHKVTVLASQDPTGRSEINEDGVRILFLNDVRAVRRRDTFANLVLQSFERLHQIEPFHILHSVDSAAFSIGKEKARFRTAIAYDVEATQMSQIFAILGMAQETLGSLLSTSFAVAYKFLRTFYSRDYSLLKSADGIFVTSPQQRIVLERYYLYPDARIYTVPYGIEIGDLSTREKSDELRVKLGIPETAKIIVTISDMSEINESKNLLTAFEQVVVKRPNTRMIVLGNGPKFHEIEYAMLNLALGNRVVLAGAIHEAELPDYIALADVFVNLSSRTTGFEPSLLEAMIQKKVIIGSEVSPIATIVEHAKDGFLIRPADAGELTTLLLDIFAGQLSVADIGENARQKILDLFDTEKMLIETVNAYYAILQSTPYYRRRR